MIQKNKNGNPEENKNTGKIKFGKNLSSMFQKPIITSTELNNTVKENKQKEKQKEKDSGGCWC